MVEFTSLLLPFVASCTVTFGGVPFSVMQLNWLVVYKSKDCDSLRLFLVLHKRVFSYCEA